MKSNNIPVFLECHEYCSVQDATHYRLICWGSHKKGRDVQNGMQYKYTGELLLSLLNGGVILDFTKEQLAAEFGPDLWVVVNDFSVFIQTISKLELIGRDPDPNETDIQANFYRSYAEIKKIERFSSSGEKSSLLEYNSITDFLSEEYRSLENSSHPIRWCRQCGRFYLREKRNQKCCGSPDCKEAQYREIRRYNRSMPVFKARRNALNRIANKFLNDQSKAASEAGAFIDTYENKRRVLSDLELIQWCDSYCRTYAKHKSSTKVQVRPKNDKPV